MFTEYKLKQFTKSSHSKLRSPIEVPAQYFSQHVDHFNKFLFQKWNQRYYTNFKYASSTSEYIFLSIGGEEEIASEEIYDERYPIVRWAQKFGARLFLLEHRFYGESQPMPDQTFESLKYLSIGQALEDISEFINGTNRHYALHNPVWIVFGGSYPGALALWARQQYPHQISGAVSSSAAIEATIDFWAYRKTAETHFRSTSEKCAENIESAFLEIFMVLQSSYGRMKIANLFRMTSSVEMTERDARFLLSILSYYITAPLMHNRHVNVSGHWIPFVAAACKLMENRNQSPIQNLANVIELLRNHSLAKNVWSYNDFISFMHRTGDKRAWYWQMCTELGFFQTSNGMRRPMLFGSLPLSLFIDECTDIFGKEFKRDSIEAAVQKTNSLYGGVNGYKGTNVVITINSEDPWLSACKHSSNDSSVVMYLIKGGYHTEDLAPNPPKSLRAGVREAHKIVERNIGIWLNNPHNNNLKFQPPQNFVRPHVRRTYPRNIHVDMLLPSQKIYPQWAHFRRIHLGRPPFGFVSPLVDFGDTSPIQCSFITQPVDHFNEDDTRTFQQKYYKNTQWARSGGPMLLVIGGESPLSSSWVKGFRMFHMELAKDVGAVVFALEHRYYGDSIVGGTADYPNPDLKYLSSLQMLYDVAHFIRTMNAEMKNSSPWITFGGSYAGSLSVWMRELFPNLVLGAVGSSPLLEAKLDFYEFMQTVGKSLNSFLVSKTPCGSILSKGFHQMKDSIFSPDQRALIYEMLRMNAAWKPEKLVSHWDVEHAFYAVHSTLQTIAYRENFAEHICRSLSESDLPVVNLERAIRIANNEYQSNYDDTSSDLDYVVFLRSAHIFGPDAAAVRLWTWQACTEFGLFPTTDSVDEVFVHATPISYFAQICTRVFQEEFTADRIKSGIDRTNLMYGGIHNYKGTNVAITTSTNDPWRTLSNISLNPNVTTVLINGGYHCADMFTEASADVKQAQAKVVQFVKKLLNIE